MWRIIFKNRQHYDIEYASNANDATVKAEGLNPTFGKAVLAIIDPPETIRHCPGCGQFIAKDYLKKSCRECASQRNWVAADSDYAD